MADTYRFHLEFTAHIPGTIDHSEKRYQIPQLGEMNAKLCCIDDDTISQGKEFSLSGNDFQNGEEAYVAGKRLKDSLLLSGVELHIGIDVGTDKPNTWIHPSILQSRAGASPKILPTVHGLTVSKESCRLISIRSSKPSIICPITAERFADTVSRIYRASRNLSDKQRLALELYSASYYELSSRARFLTLVMVLEVLAEQTDREPDATEFVKYMLRQLDISRINKRSKASLEGSLSYLLKESISKSLKALAETHLCNRTYDGKSVQKFVAYCYEIRSGLVHNGTIPHKFLVEEGVHSDIELLDRKAPTLSDFISDLLVETTGIQKHTDAS